MLFLTIVLASHHLSTNVANAASPSGLLITEFYPCALSDDEYFVLTNAGSERMNLLNWSITDGEGVLRFDEDVWLEPSASFAISSNSTSYSMAYGRSPELDADVSAEILVRSGSLRLADSGDSLALVSPIGAEADFVRYGTVSEESPNWSGASVPSIRQGEVCKRIKTSEGWCDSNSASDWEPFRDYRYGYTQLSPLAVDVAAGELVAFVSPDCSLDVVLESIRGAQASLRLCSYELSSASVCTELLRASVNGVSVMVLVDGAPAGGISDEEKVCLSALVDGGVKVSVINGNLTQKIVQHVGPLHCKYAVMDDETSLILSENFVESGLPLDRVLGNRGWGVRIASEPAARYLSSLFDSDSRATRPDVRRWIDDERYRPSAVIPEPQQSNHSYGAMPPLRTTAGATIQLLPSPDSSETRPFLASLMSNANSLLVEQFQVELDWTTRWEQGAYKSPLVESIEQAMRHGSSVRMIFDSSWYNAEGNGPACRYMSGLCANDSLRGEFRMMDPRNPIQVVHNKGVVIDGRDTLVSSNNWGFSSFARNRELAALISSQEVAEYFTKAFDMDWTADDTPPMAEAGPDRTARLGSVVELDASRSWDDRVISHYGWDTDGDGFMESDQRCTTLIPCKVGRLELRLFVEDAWGNEGMDKVTVTVIEEGSIVSRTGPFWGFSRLAAVLSLAGGILIGRRFALRRLRGSGKINQRPGA